MTSQPTRQITGKAATMCIIDDVAELSRPYQSKKPRPFHHFLKRADRSKIEILAQRASEAAAERNGQKYSSLFGRMSKMFGRQATKTAIENADNIRRMCGLEDAISPEDHIVNWRIGKQLGPKARSEAIDYILLSAGTHNNKGARARLKVLDDHALWMRWLRS